VLATRVGWAFHSATPSWFAGRRLTLSAKGQSLACRVIGTAAVRLPGPFLSFHWFMVWLCGLRWRGLPPNRLPRFETRVPWSRRRYRSNGALPRLLWMFLDVVPDLLVQVGWNIDRRISRLSHRSRDGFLYPRAALEQPVGFGQSLVAWHHLLDAALVQLPPDERNKLVRRKGIELNPLLKQKLSLVWRGAVSAQILGRCSCSILGSWRTWSTVKTIR
jgi:hypothetical protein